MPADAHCGGVRNGGSACAHEIAALLAGAARCLGLLNAPSSTRGAADGTRTGGMLDELASSSLVSGVDFLRRSPWGGELLRSDCDGGKRTATADFREYSSLSAGTMGSALDKSSVVDCLQRSEPLLGLDGIRTGLTDKRPVWRLNGSELG